MPTYDYEHAGDGCKLGKRFELVHSMSEPAQKTCPECGQPVGRIISPVGISTPKGNSELKGMGFTKLVRRDQGVYENVTALDGESKVFEAGKPETMPDLKRKISD
jgi:putative FmdB family regulatory protein